MTGQLAALLAVATAAISITAAVLAVRTPGLQLRWLWAIACLIGFGWLQAGWQSGDIYMGFGVNLPPFGASRQAGGGEWWVRASVPAIAILFLGLRATGRLKRLQSQEVKT